MVLHKSITWEDNIAMRSNLRILNVYGMIGRSGPQTVLAMVSMTVITVQMFLQITAIFDALFAITALSVLIKAAIVLCFEAEYRTFYVQVQQMTDDINREKIDAFTAHLERSKRSGLLYSKLMNICCIIGALVFCSFCFLFPNEDGSRRMIYDTWAPFDQQISPNFELSCAFQVYVTGVCLFFHLATNNLSIQTLMFCGALFSILIERLSMVFEDVEKLFKLRQSSTADEAEMIQLAEDIDVKMGNLIAEHISAMHFLNLAAPNLSYILGTDFVCYTLVICTQMFTFSLMEEVGQQITILFIAGLSCASAFLWNYHAELVRTKSEDFCRQLYAVRWELANRKVRKAIQFMIARAQQPIQLNLLHILPIGMGRIVQMMNTSYTYFTLLRTLYD
ncbi:odorant receptor Or2-like [Sabethes cyaneus]|uniref:odorant receptor Or2-like n=1 Tax=Sabethes cyaneus TaxID=53552 RepID=UPI00237E62AF|nr:odorant receptor Or2-like [Sabethes cyaneus]